MKYTSVNSVKQTMAVFHARLLKMLDNNIVSTEVGVCREIRQRQDFFDTLTAVVLVGDFENVSIFGAVPMIVGAVVMRMTTMMDGNPQP